MTEQFEQAVVEAEMRGWWTPGPDADAATRDRWARVVLQFAELVDERVPAKWGCPACGETRMDWLGWGEDGETVTCATCRAEYVLA